MADVSSGSMPQNPVRPTSIEVPRRDELPPGTLVIADEARPLALMFGAIGSGRGVSSKTKRTILCAIQVRGVPDIAVEEAIWLAAGVMRS
jgi:hypothetical protein